MSPRITFWVHIALMLTAFIAGGWAVGVRSAPAFGLFVITTTAATLISVFLPERPAPPIVPPVPK